MCRREGLEWDWFGIKSGGECCAKGLHENGLGFQTHHACSESPNEFFLPGDSVWMSALEEMVSSFFLPTEDAE